MSSTTDFDPPLLRASARDERLTKRSRLVEAGKQLLVEHFSQASPDPEKAFQFVSPSRIASVAGVSKGLLYHLWGTDEADQSPFLAYIAEVLGEVISEVSDHDFLLAELSAFDDSESETGEVIRTIADGELRSILSGRRRTALMISLALASYCADGELNAAARDASGRSYERFVEFYSSAMEALGREMSEQPGTGRPLTVLDLSRALSCLTEGYAAEALTFPEIVDEEINFDGGVWSSYAIAVEAIVLHMSRLRT